MFNDWTEVQPIIVHETKVRKRIKMASESDLSKNIELIDRSLHLKICLQFVNKMLSTNFSFMKPKQAECTSVSVGSDVICVLPTGYGKSLLFNTIPVYNKLMNNIKTPVVVILISPLNVIIHQQQQLLGNRASIVSGKASRLSVSYM
jgi:superfamily II DNA helicase RecQ